MLKNLRKKNFFRLWRGVVFLPFVLIIGGILIEITAAFGIFTLLNINSNQSLRFSAEALSVARAGTADAMLQVVNNKNFSSTCYRVLVGSRTAYVVVSRDIPVAGETSIYSKATILNRTRILYTILNVNSGTGEVNLVSTQESTSAVSCP